MASVNWDLVGKSLARERHRLIWRPYGLPRVLDFEGSAFHNAGTSEPWDVPEKLIVSVAVTGAFIRHDQNPNQAITPDEIRSSARECLHEGASTVHIHVRDDNGYNVLSEERFKSVIEPLKNEFPDLAVDACMVPALDGEWEAMKRVLGSRILDGAPINTTATYLGDSLFVKPTAMLMEKARLVSQSGAVPEIVVYNDGDVSNADRFLFRSGLVATPAVWLVLPALPGCNPMNNPHQMVEGLQRTVAVIRDVDPGGLIMVCAAGRASMHLAALAAAMGLHIRVGMEDTYWKWPHRADRIESNLECLRLAKHLAEAVGRPIATRAEYRAALGLPTASTPATRTVMRS